MLQKPKNYAVIGSVDSFIVTADGAPLLTPAGKPYALPNLALAEAIRDEWQQQGKKINPASMPLTQFAATALDIVACDQDCVITQLMAYLDNEMLCQQVIEPEILQQRQQKIWQPYLDWCQQNFGVQLVISHDLAPAAQSPETHAAIAAMLARMDHFWLAGLAEATSVTGSLILALALLHDFSDVDSVLAAAELETLHQTEQWGEDPLVIARHDSIRQDLTTIKKWFRLLV